MADKMREILLSERGREIVNVVFFLSFLLRNRGIVFAAYVVWGIYLWPNMLPPRHPGLFTGVLWCSRG